MREVLTDQDIVRGEAVRLLPSALQKGRPTPARSDKYGDRLIKYVPAEVIAVYLAVDGSVRGMKKLNPEVPDQKLLAIATVILLVGTWLYLKRVQKVQKIQQLAISVFSFAVWVFTIGGPFAYFSWYSPLYGAAFLPLYTFCIAIVEAKR